MLRIKENVNLDILKHLGFEDNDICYSYELENEGCIEDKTITLVIYKKDFRHYKQREIYIYTDEVEEDNLYHADILFDLIKADLVEKVG